MIRHYKGTTKTGNSWNVGNTVKVGFMTLKVMAKIPTPDDGLPDKYLLESSKDIQYEFVPHNGLSRID